MSLCPGGLLFGSVAELSARIHRDFAYVPDSPASPPRCRWFWSTGAGCARTSPTWPSPACAPMAWPRDFDPTNNHCPDNRHITVAWGRDYGDVTPMKGVVYGGGQQQATVSVEVINLLEG